MPLLRLENVELAFGERHILDSANLLIEKGQRIGLIGRNGEGKSTLLKILSKTQEVDSGSVWWHPDLRIAVVEQILPPLSDLPVADYVASGSAEVLEDLKQFEQISLSENPDLNAMSVLQQRIDSADGWSFDHRLQRILKDFELDQGQKLGELSGGWRRKAALARALVSEPDLLLLDEPTNHLDVGLIQWLEAFLNNYSGAVIIITHDRAFLRATCTQIAELDRGTLVSWQGSYGKFLEFKQQELDNEEKHNALFDKRLAQEEAWIREGIKARRTRNEGRVRALKKLREQRAERRTVSSMNKLEIAGTESSGKIVAELDGVSLSFAGKTIISNFSSTLIRGDKIGLIGPNGAGKSTLLKLILGDLVPDSGTIKIGTKLEVAYFDQMRDQLNMEADIVDNVAEGRQRVTVNGKDKHILSYLQDFMFSPARARTPLKALSGGECARVMLAKLFSKPSNLLVMDEPTNDLDTETLELLESLLVDYPGTVLLVSHDREFIDNVVSTSVVFEGKGKLSEFVGGYQDWLRQGGDWERIIQSFAAKSNTDVEIPTPAVASVTKPKKLSYKLQRELESLPRDIEKLELRVEGLNKEMCAPEFYTAEPDSVQNTLTELSECEAKLVLLYARWEELEASLEE